MTKHAYDVVQRYRDLGGNLMFLSANNFFWKVERKGQRLVRIKQWRALGRPESALVGVQYAGSNHGAEPGRLRRSPERARRRGHSPGRGSRDGDTFGRYGIEIDERRPTLRPAPKCWREIPDILPNAGRSAEMTYYETPAGAKVFAAGALNFAASVNEPVVSQLLENLWARLSLP